MIFLLFNIIRQLFIQIMCKNQLIQVNRMQEIINNVDLPLVLTHPPEKSPTARPLSVIANLHILCFSGQHVSELHTYHFLFFKLRLHVFHVQFCCFRIGHSSARNYRAFEKIDILFYKYYVKAHIS